jgi:large subunit ribosomal protein L9
MEVILIQDVKNLGYKNDLVKVKNGYANNYLIPQGYAILATPVNRKVLGENLKQQTFKENRTRNEAESLKKKIESISLSISQKVSATGKIFGSVNNIQIANALLEQHQIEVDRKKISFEPVKEIGSYSAKIAIFKDIDAVCQFEVIAEE